MPYYVHITVNTAKGEFDYPCAGQDSLDGLMARVLQMHPNATSVVMAIVPNKDRVNVTFQAETVA